MALTLTTAALEGRAPVPLPGLRQGLLDHSRDLFANHKLPLRCYLAAIAIFCNEVKGKSTLALSRDLNVSYKCAFVLLHKLREAMAAELKGRVIGGDGKVAEVERGYFGGYVKPANLQRASGRSPFQRKSDPASVRPSS